MNQNPSLPNTSTSISSNPAVDDSAAQPAAPTFDQWTRSVLPPDQSRVAYEALRPQMDALDPTSLAPIRISVAQAVDVVRHFAPALKQLEPSIDATVRNWQPGIAERLLQLADAVEFTQTAFEVTRRPSESLEPLFSKCVEHRRRLGIVLEPLAQLGLIDRALLDRQRDGRNPSNVGMDVRGMVALMESHAAPYRNQTLYSDAELAQARIDAQALREAVARRTVHETMRVPAAEVRSRAWTLMTRAWDETRAAGLYTRRAAGDADAYCPSMVALLRKEREPGTDATEDTDATGTPPQPAAPARAKATAKPEPKDPAANESLYSDEDRAAYARFKALADAAGK